MRQASKPQSVTRSRLAAAARAAAPAVVQPMERRVLLSAAVLTGTVTGTAGSYNNQGNVVAKAFDGNLSTFFDGPTANGDVAGLDLGAPKVVTQVSYAPRAGFASRMVGGVFQGSNTPDFSAGVATLYTVAAAPAAGSLTSAAVSDPTAYEYVRYVAPNGSYGNVAEVQFAGYAPPPAVLSNGVLTVTGTAGADTIDIEYGTGNVYDVTANGTTQSFDADQVGQIVVNAGDGNDTLTYSAPSTMPVQLNGQGGNDGITVAYAGNVTLDGGDGNDLLIVTGSANAHDTLVGGAGNDVLSISGGVGGLLDGGDGNDVIDIGDGSFPNLPVTVTGGAGTDSVGLQPAGGTYVSLDGKPDSNLDGFPSGAGSQFAADIENVSVNALDGGTTTVVGDALDNVITVTNAQYGNVSLYGGDGNDTLSSTDYASSIVTSFLSGGTGNDKLTAYGNSSLAGGGTLLAATLQGDDGNDTLVGGFGTDFSGGGGTDVVDFTSVTDPLTVYLDGSHPSGTAAQIAAGTGDTFDGTVEEVYGGSGNDLLAAAPGGGDALYGNGGNDTLVAQGGTDALFGGDGNDTLDAADGGSTYVDGGAGTDTATIDPAGDTTVNVETVNTAGGGGAAPVQLSGTTTGTAGANGLNPTATVARATDGDLTTFFDSAVANGDYVQLDLGSARTVSRIGYAPRNGFANRMVGGVFQASNAADFSSGVVTAYTITAAPAVGALTTVTPSTTAAYRYWRYVAPAGSYGNIAEFQLFGPAATPPVQLTGTTTGTAGANALNPTATVAKATDGDLTTFFDSAAANGNYVQLDLGSARAVTQIKYAPRANFAARMVGGVFQASNSATFATGVVTAYTITAAPAQGALTTVTPATATAYRYWRYVAPAGSYGNIAEFQLFGPAAATPTRLAGTTSGTAGANGLNPTATVAKATDGDLTTFFDSAAADGNVVEIDLGSGQAVSQIGFAPRNGFASRMVGGVFQASNSATFATGVVTAYTIAAAPAQGVLTTVTPATTAAYRYWRYVAPAGSYGNIAEFELFG